MPPIEQIAEFASAHPLLVAGLGGSIVLLVFSEIQRKLRAQTDLTPQDVVRLMNDDAQVIDVRSAESFAKGHLVNAKNIPMAQFNPDDEPLAAWKEKPLIAVCDNGFVGAKAAARLRAAGFENVYSLKGGIPAWQQDNLPLVTGRKSSKKRERTRKGKNA